MRRCDAGFAADLQAGFGRDCNARSERYDKPGKAPQMAAATIMKISGGDFTVNAMALSLNEDRAGCDGSVNVRPTSKPK